MMNYKLGKPETEPVLVGHWDLLSRQQKLELFVLATVAGVDPDISSDDLLDLTRRNFRMRNAEIAATFRTQLEKTIREADDNLRTKTADEKSKHEQVRLEAVRMANELVRQKEAGEPHLARVTSVINLLVEYWVRFSRAQHEQLAAAVFGGGEAVEYRSDILLTMIHRHLRACDPVTIGLFRVLLDKLIQQLKPKTAGCAALFYANLQRDLQRNDDSAYMQRAAEAKARRLTECKARLVETNELIRKIDLERKMSKKTKKETHKAKRDVDKYASKLIVRLSMHWSSLSTQQQAELYRVAYDEDPAGPLPLDSSDLDLLCDHVDEATDLEWLVDFAMALRSMIKTVKK